MLKQIKIRNDVMNVILESFLSLTEVEDAIETIRNIHRDIYDINWRKYNESFDEETQQVVVKPDGIKEYLRQYFEKHYNWTTGSIFQPQAFFVLQHPDNEQSIYFGTESGITSQPYCTPSKIHPHFLPSWILRGKVRVGNEKIQDTSKYGEIAQRVVLSFHPLPTELPFMFFQYIENGVLDDTTNEESSIEAINSFYHPEQLGALTTESLSNNDIKVLHHNLLRHKRIRYSSTNVTNTVVSTPSPNIKHREPNPSDRKDYRPHRQIASPTYDICYVRTIPSLPGLEPQEVKVGRVKLESKEPTKRTFRKILGADIFQA